MGRLKRLNSKHVQAIRLRARGWTYEEIGTHLGVAHGTVGNWFADPLLKEKLAELQSESLDEARRILESSAAGAARYLGAASNCKDPDYKATNATGVRAAVAILDRVGLPSQDDPGGMDLAQIVELLQRLPPGVKRAILAGDRDR